MRALLDVSGDDLHGLFPSQGSRLIEETSRWAIHPYDPASSDLFPWQTLTRQQSRDKAYSAGIP
jgi:hypothetical protein